MYVLQPAATMQLVAVFLNVHTSLELVTMPLQKMNFSSSVSIEAGKVMAAHVEASLTHESF